jgi:hypothetical protein
MNAAIINIYYSILVFSTVKLFITAGFEQPFAVPPFSLSDM